MLADDMRYNSMHMIRHAIRFGESDSGLLPHAYQVDIQSGAETSWRILIEDRDSYSCPQYDNSLAWNSNENLQATRDFCSVKYDPSKPYTTSIADIPHTDFVVIVGDETLFVDDQSFSLDEITDGPENTIVVVEILNSDIPWTEPRDLEMNQPDSLRRYLSQPESPGNDLIGFEGQYLLFADFEILRVALPMPMDDFLALLTPNGGESVTRKQLIADGYLISRGNASAD